MSWLSEHREKKREYNRIVRLLVDKGEINTKKYILIGFAELCLIIGFLSFLLPLSVINPYLPPTFDTYPKIEIMFLAYAVILIVGLFALELWSIKLDIEIDKKVKAYLKEEK